MHHADTLLAVCSPLSHSLFLSALSLSSHRCHQRHPDRRRRHHQIKVVQLSKRHWGIAATRRMAMAGWTNGLCARSFCVQFNHHVQLVEAELNDIFHSLKQAIGWTLNTTYFPLPFYFFSEIFSVYFTPPVISLDFLLFCAVSFRMDSVIRVRKCQGNERQTTMIQKATQTIRCQTAAAAADKKCWEPKKNKKISKLNWKCRRDKFAAFVTDYKLTQITNNVLISNGVKTERNRSTLPK